MTTFKAIRARAARRKGGERALSELLPPAPDARKLARLKDDRVLAEMARRIFSAGFVWSVIESKWDGFEDAFLGFEPRRLLFQPEDFWHELTHDTRIVRNGAKIMAVRDNARFVTEIAGEHGSFGKFLAAWPSTDQLGLTDFLGKHGARLGGNTGQYFLRFIGWDGYVLSRDVVACLRDAGCDIAESPTSKKDRRRIQDQFNAWSRESGLPMLLISRICAMSIGENRDAETLRRYGGGEET
jgi:3-methyladenine DNA glycosylase Tag